MSGHSKWSKVKHQKATTDAVKSQAFTKASRAVTVAVREGGKIADPEKNFRLRLAIEQAKAVNMPKSNIARAIERGSGESGSVFERILYEGYGPGGVAFLAEAATDNHQRTGALVKHEFDRAGGSLASPGAVSYQFIRSGLLLITKSANTFDAILEAALSAGADDVVERDDVFEIYTRMTTLSDVSHYLTSAGFRIELTEFIMHPQTLTHPSENLREKNEQLAAALDALEDIQKVFTNMD